MKTFEEFRKEIVDWAKNDRPKDWRYGQAVFNAVDEVYGVARTVQFKDGVDCFYSDECVDMFLQKAYDRCIEYGVFGDTEK